MNILERISVNSNHSSRHPRESGDPGATGTSLALGPRFRGDDSEDDSASSKLASPADTEATALPRGVAQALADPIVRALMAADRIDPKSMAELMCRMAARLRNRPASAAGGLPW